jgi:hypothetical protein
MLSIIQKVLYMPQSYTLQLNPKDYVIISKPVALKAFARINAMIEGYFAGREEPEVQKAWAQWKALYKNISSQGLQQVSRTQNVNTDGSCISEQLNSALDEAMIDALGIECWLELKKCLVALNRLTMGVSRQQSFLYSKGEGQNTSEFIKQGDPAMQVTLFDLVGWQLQMDYDSAMLFVTPTKSYIAKIQNPLLQDIMQETARALLQDTVIAKYQHLIDAKVNGKIEQASYMAPIVSDFITELLVQKSLGGSFLNFTKYGTKNLSDNLYWMLSSETLWGQDITGKNRNSVYVQHLICQALIVALKMIADDPELKKLVQGMTLRLPNYALRDNFLTDLERSSFQENTQKALKDALKDDLDRIHKLATELEMNSIDDTLNSLSPIVYARHPKNDPVAVGNGSNGFTVHGNEVYETFAPVIQDAILDMVRALRIDRNQFGYLFGSVEKEYAFLEAINAAQNINIPQEKNAYALVLQLKEYVEKLQPSKTQGILLGHLEMLLDYAVIAGSSLEAYAAARIGLRSVLECNPHHNTAKLYVFSDNQLIAHEEYVPVLMNDLGEQLAKDKAQASQTRDAVFNQYKDEYEKSLDKFWGDIERKSTLSLPELQVFDRDLKNNKNKLGAILQDETVLREKYERACQLLAKKEIDLKRQALQELRDKVSSNQIYHFSHLRELNQQLKEIRNAGLSTIPLELESIEKEIITILMQYDDKFFNIEYQDFKKIRAIDLFRYNRFGFDSIKIGEGIVTPSQRAKLLFRRDLIIKLLDELQVEIKTNGKNVTIDTIELWDSILSYAKRESISKDFPAQMHELYHAEVQWIQNWRKLQQDKIAESIATSAPIVPSYRAIQELPNVSEPQEQKNFSLIDSYKKECTTALSAFITEQEKLSEGLAEIHKKLLNTQISVVSETIMDISETTNISDTITKLSDLASNDKICSNELHYIIFKLIKQQDVSVAIQKYKKNCLSALGDYIQHRKEDLTKSGEQNPIVQIQIDTVSDLTDKIMEGRSVNEITEVLKALFDDQNLTGELQNIAGQLMDKYDRDVFMQKSGLATMSRS